MQKQGSVSTNKQTIKRRITCYLLGMGMTVFHLASALKIAPQSLRSLFHAIQLFGSEKKGVYPVQNNPAVEYEMSNLLSVTV
jgi:hypothetical protein